MRENEGCGPLCRFMYYCLEKQWDIAKAEFDRLLMSSDLQAFVERLSREGITGSEDPRAVLGDEYASVLRSGFADKDDDLMRRVLRNSACLSPLVDLLFVEGSDYWMEQLAPPTAAETAMSERIRAAVMDKISQSEPTPE